MRFRDRRDAGRRLAERISGLDLTDPLVLGLPRGGVPVAFEIAYAIDAPLDVFVARKVGAPGHQEYGIGAIAEGGVVIADDDALARLGIDRDEFDVLGANEQLELQRRVLRYRGDRAIPDVTLHDIIVVDDGLATGVTAHAAIVALRRAEARAVLLAVPVGAPDAIARLAEIADSVVCLAEPPGFVAVGQWYDDFDATSDDEVTRLLDVARER